MATTLEEDIREQGYKLLTVNVPKIIQKSYDEFQQCQPTNDIDQNEDRLWHVISREGQPEIEFPYRKGRRIDVFFGVCGMKDFHSENDWGRIVACENPQDISSYLIVSPPKEIVPTQGRV